MPLSMSRATNTELPLRLSYTTAVAPFTKPPGFELTKPKAQAIASELESHQTRRTSKETQDETQDTPPKIDQKTVRKTLGVLKNVLLVDNDSKHVL